AGFGDAEVGRLCDLHPPVVAKLADQTVAKYLTAEYSRITLIRKRKRYRAGNRVPLEICERRKGAEFSRGLARRGGPRAALASQDNLESGEILVLRRSF